MKNRFAIVTGASRGIGRGIAIELAQHGFDLLINYQENKSAAEETAALCQEAAGRQAIRAEICQANISNAEDRRRMVEFAREQFQRIDLLVNNAGVAPRVRSDILEATEESFDRLIDINLKGPYFLTQLIAKWMIEQTSSASPTSAGMPKIITVSSISAYAASTSRGDYCVSKAALAMVTKLFAARLAEHGINVYEIRPGVIATDMTMGVKEKYDGLIAQGLTPIKRWGQPGDVAKAVAAIALDYLPFSTGEVINVDGGFHLHRL